MANIDLKFLSYFDRKETIQVTNETTATGKRLIYIELIDSCGISGIYLDESTAIKFAKTVRTEIAKIKE